jgi:3-oxoacyl-[acyl-carrier-protein] synthase III
MVAKIVGIGAYYPDQILTNDVWPADFGKGERRGDDRTFNDIPPAQDLQAERITARHLAAEALDPFLGCERRHIADEQMTSSEAEAIAARAALENAGISADEVDMLISYAMVPDAVAPPHACRVTHLLGSSRALAWGVEAACAALIVQLATAAALVDSKLAKTVVLTQSHLLLRAMPRLHPATPGLGDAATACVVRSEGRGLEIISIHGATHGEFFDAVGWVRPELDEQRWWKAGGAYRLGSRNSAAAKLLMRDTVAIGARTVREVCDKAHVAVDEIDLFASVMPRGWVPPSILECLNLPPDRAVTTYRHTGHLGAVGPIANLLWARDQKRIHDGALVALYAQGAGFARGAALLRA